MPKMEINKQYNTLRDAMSDLVYGELMDLPVHTKFNMLCALIRDKCYRHMDMQKEIDVCLK